MRPRALPLVAALAPLAFFGCAQLLGADFDVEASAASAGAGGATQAGAAQGGGASGAPGVGGVAGVGKSGAAGAPAGGAAGADPGGSSAASGAAGEGPRPGGAAGEASGTGGESGVSGAGGEPPESGAGGQDPTMGGAGAAGAETGDGGASGGGAAGAEVVGAGVGGAGAGGAGAGGAGGPGMGGGSTVKYCPSQKGPAFVQVPLGPGTTMCIDETEVTLAQYEEFVSANVPVADQPAECSANKSFQRNATCSKKVTTCKGATCPATCVNWCDASAYCKWAGKRLCGAIAGGPVAPGEIDQSTISQWMHVCSNGEDPLGPTSQFPYGNTFDKSICDTADVSGCDPYVNCKALPVKSHPDCTTTGKFAGVYDMSGKVWEWEDNCKDDTCHVRGGSAFSIKSANSCGQVSDPLDRLTGFDSVGFRCCSL
jgi:formylglycine-generating enzyme